MKSYSIFNGLPTSVHIPSGERRRNQRHELHMHVLLRILSDSWTLGETVNVSTNGVSFITDQPFLLSAPIDYLLTFPPDLTKAPKPLRVRFFGTVLRCERAPDGKGPFRIAVRSYKHRYLSLELSGNFDAIEQNLLEKFSTTAAFQPRKIGT